ncbi:class I SAM-dependent methyltransferase [Patulibacter defluvii]|uniref:class I SAM-dependent methyltransferase n=1 Tax=Patulibacter defluvii TaxID=3095358 RepID=UPI002A75F302|nr:methyltransferase domain-containing protein [Patulibacter sp. DM4]
MATTFGPEHPEWSARWRTATSHVIPWIAEHVPLADATVLEYGCGQGAVSCAFGPHVARHIGVDIDADAVEQARFRVAERGLDNVDLRALPVGGIVDQVRALDQRIDVVLLYAVVEHLTRDERLAVLEMARDVVAEDGHVVIVECPNRLTPVDHHSSRLPFVDGLPEDVLARYAERSPRASFVEDIAAARAAGGAAAERLALVRAGRGVSFHEFELVFGDLAQRTVASSYAESLYGVRPVLWEELQLAAMMDGWRPDLPPAWSRSWIDTILSARPLDDPPALVRPWRMRIDPDAAGAAWVRDDGRIVLGPGMRLPVRLPTATDELHVGMIASEDPRHAVRVHVGDRTLSPLGLRNRLGTPPWHAVAALPWVTDHVELSLAGGGELTFVGYAAAPGAPTGLDGWGSSRVFGW